MQCEKKFGKPIDQLGAPLFFSKMHVYRCWKSSDFILFPALDGGDVSNPITESAAHVRWDFHPYGTLEIPLNNTEVVFPI